MCYLLQFCNCIQHFTFLITYEWAGLNSVVFLASLPNLV
jgi:hypothetical protein